MADSTSVPVYLGVWTNWSRGVVMGATLTTTQRLGALLVAFTGFLVPYVAARFWTICCLVFHRCYSTRRPRGALHHQRQVILRNSPTPEAGLLSLGRLCWAWRGARGSSSGGGGTDEGKNKKRSQGEGDLTPGRAACPPLLLALFSAAAFAVAGGFSSRISTGAGNEVLLTGAGCGIVASVGESLNSPTTAYYSELVSNAYNYAQQCYNSANASGLLSCREFVVRTLPTAVSNTSAGCPFRDGMCRSDDANVSFDTGLVDSNDGLGINAPEDQRIAWRYVLQCAPIVTQGYTTTRFADNQTWMSYNYGAHWAGSAENGTYQNWTYLVQDVEQQFRQTPHLGTLNGLDYRLANFPSSTIGGQVEEGSTFVPIPEVFRSDGDFTLVFLSGDGVRYAGSAPLDDPWYRANVPSDPIVVPNESGQLDSYIPDEAASPLGCVEQYQWCNKAILGAQGCGPLASLLDSLDGAAPLFNISADANGDSNDTSAPTSTEMRLMWPAWVLNDGYAGSLASVLSQLASKSLASESTLIGGVQYGSLPNNQWQLDVVGWWEAVLASMQLVFVDAALGPTDDALGPYTTRPETAEERTLCRSQKIRSDAYTSFSLFGLLFTYITGILVVVASFILDPILACLQRRKRYREYAQLEWTTNETLQLHRLAHEETTVGGKWSGCVDAIPITAGQHFLAGLDISDLEHPILARGYDMAEKTYFEDSTTEGGSPTETALFVSDETPSPMVLSTASGTHEGDGGERVQNQPDPHVSFSSDDELRLFQTEANETRLDTRSGTQHIHTKHGADGAGNE